MTPDTAGSSGEARVGSPGVRPGGSPPPEQDQDWPRALVRRVAVALALKLVILGALWWWFFSPAHRPDARGPAVARHFLSESGNPR